jgi:hypothetical protein
VKIDDPKSPLTAMFHGREFEIHNETYAFARNSFSRKNVHVLTSIDYNRMSEADRNKEPAATGMVTIRGATSTSRARTAYSMKRTGTTKRSTR